MKRRDSNTSFEDVSHIKIAFTPWRCSVFICYKNGDFSLPKQPHNLDPSYKMDLDFWDCLESLIAELLTKLYTLTHS